jgi:hypothetical protein
MPNTNPSQIMPGEAQRHPAAAVAATMSASAAMIEPPDNGKLGMSHATSLLPIISTYLKPADIEKVQAAFEMARAAHEGQSRKSG